METITYVDALTEDVCRHLLAAEDVGRVAFVDDDGYPVVLPVNYFFEGDLIVFRTDVGSKLDGVPLRRVAFEVDHLAPANHSGWSILVQGQGRELTNALGAAYEALRERHIDTWAPGEKGHWLAIKVDHISGRQIVRPNTGEGP